MCATDFVGVLLEVHVSVFVGVDQLELPLVEFKHRTDVHVTQREVLGELDWIAWLVRLLHSASLQELPASETCVQSTAVQSLTNSTHGIYRTGCYRKNRTKFYT